MNILLTGASGFVGSHVLDRLCDLQHQVSILLRPTSDTRFISHRLADVAVHRGSLDELRSLHRALEGAEAVVHCAGKTKAIQPSEFYRANRNGTRNLVTAANDFHRTLRHFVHISSQAVSGPSGIARPREETEPPNPVSIYGRSKLSGEKEVCNRSRVPWTILRPAAVYGPRDSDFLRVFLTVRRGIMPILAGGARPFSLVFAPDAAAAVSAALGSERAIGKIYHVAAAAACSDEALMREIAAQLHLRPLRIRMPRLGLFLACLVQGLHARITGRPNILSLHKIPELTAPGWVCSTERIRIDLGYNAPTSLPEGVARTLSWYRRKGWI